MSFGKAGRLLFVYDREHVHRDGTLVAEKVIRVGYMLCDHDKVIGMARRGYPSWLSAELEDTDGWKDWFETRLPANPVALTQIELVAKDLPDEDFWHVYWNFAADCEATPDNNREGSSWYLTEVDALNGETGENAPNGEATGRENAPRTASRAAAVRGVERAFAAVVERFGGKREDYGSAVQNARHCRSQPGTAQWRMCRTMPQLVSVKPRKWFRLLPRRELKPENVHFLTYEALLAAVACGRGDADKQESGDLRRLAYLLPQTAGQQDRPRWLGVRNSQHHQGQFCR